MFSVYETTSLLNRLKLKDVVQTTVRYSVKKVKTSADRAREHFDQTYKQIYGKRWDHIRSALLTREIKYVAVANNYGDVDETLQSLHKSDALDLRILYDSQQEVLKERNARKKLKREEYRLSQNIMGPDCSSEEISSDNLSDDGVSVNPSECCDTEDQDIKDKKPFGLIKLKSIEPDLNEVDIQTDRIIHPSNQSSTMSEFVPATEIKGFDDDWIMESDNYRLYQNLADFKPAVEQESVFRIPKYLKVYVPDKHGDDAFPKPKISSTGVLDYFLFDGGSILPVLALDLQPGDNVLDMCAAPGGKLLAILQTLTPRLVTCNDVAESRVNRLHKLIREYIPDIESCREMLHITHHDARVLDDVNVYNKILVDAPCSADRHALRSDGNTIFKPARTKERLLLPQTQAEILINAIKLVRVGGTVVYSTCTLNPLENDGAVQLALKKSMQDNNHAVVIKDMTEALAPLRTLFTFGDNFLRYGHMVIPTHNTNCGPMYFCKLVKMQ